MRHTLVITARTYCNENPLPWQHHHRSRPRKPSKMTALNTSNGDEAAPVSALSPQCARKSRFRGFMLCPAWFWWQFRYWLNKSLYHFTHNNICAHTCANSLAYTYITHIYPLYTQCRLQLLLSQKIIWKCYLEHDHILFVASMCSLYFSITHAVDHVLLTYHSNVSVREYQLFTMFTSI